MPDRPIILSAPMIRALLDGRKTQTRRVLKLNWRRPEYCGPDGCQADPTCWGWEDHNHGDWITLEKEPGQRMGWRDWRGAYAPGDRLWVREQCATWQGNITDAAYRATMVEDNWSDLLHDAKRGAPWKVRSPIHMPRWASRITLTVTDVRVQRVQDISEADAIAEAVDAVTMDDVPRQAAMSRRSDFAAIWDHIHGPGAWARNDWVAALAFDVKRGNIDG